MDESTITPIANIIPPRLIMLEVISNIYIRINEISTAIGISIRILTILLQCKRKIATIIDTVIAASIKALSKVPMASLMSVLRSYDVTISTPGGRPGEISLIFL